MADLPNGPAYADIIQAHNKLFLSGPFGCGKTTLGIQRVCWLLAQERTRGDDILVLVPQRTLGRPYQEILGQPDAPPGPPVRVMTVAGLARESVELYWPLLAEAAGFGHPNLEPSFLNLETAQFHMARFVDSAIARGDFDGVRLEHSRIVSQVLDNLNKAALHGFGIDEAYERLELAVPGGEQRTARLNALIAARRISHQYRALCLEESLVDFSLWIHLFNQQVLTNQWSRTHLFRSCHHLVVDNIEEDTYTAHQLMVQWLPSVESALVIADQDAGYRLFLGADPEGVAAVAAACDHHLRLAESYITPPALQQLQHSVDIAVHGRRPGNQQATPAPQTTASPPDGGPIPSIRTAFHAPDRPHRFYPQMLDWAVAEVQRLVNDEGIAPGRIAMLAPFVSDALRFSLQTRLGEVGIPSTSHRPSRALVAEPAARCLLTLAALAHPHWQIYPAPADLALTLDLAIQHLDPVRAHLLARVAYPLRGETGTLMEFTALKPAVQQRISFRAGEAYDRLRNWLYVYRSSTETTPLDQFFARLFGEVLSQPGFGFHHGRQPAVFSHLDAARVTHQMVQSARKFRWAVGASASVQDPAPAGLDNRDVGRAYLGLVESGAVGALYVPGWQEDETAVFIAPAYTFLMRNRPVDVQFWLDIGAAGWWERLYQPLTHPYVLSRRWPAGEPWSDFAEFQRRQEMLRRLLLGLIRRTRRHIFLGLSDYGENGLEQHGPLLALVNNVLAQEVRRS